MTVPIVPLGEIADVNWGDTNVTKSSYVEQGYTAYSATGADGFLPYADYDRQAVVLSAIGARCGKIWFADGKWSCIKNTIRYWSTDDRLDNRYLYWITNKEDFFPKRGAAQPFITIGDARAAKIPLPPLDKQQKIAAILDKADALRRKRRRTLDVLDTLTQSIFLEMFGDPIEDPRYPTRRLGEFVDHDRGISYGIVQRGDDQETGTKVLRISDMVDGYITGLGLKQTAPEIADKFRRTKLLGGEIVISIRGTVGRCAVVPSFLIGANVSREIAVIPTKIGRLNPFYLSLIRTDSAQRRLARDVKGVAQSGINLEDLRELPIILPPQSEIDNFLTAQSRFQQIEMKSREQSDKLEFLFSSLQSRAFSEQL